MFDNVRLEYLYRDAENFKIWGEVVFSNVADIELDHAVTVIKSYTLDSTPAANRWFAW